MSRIELYGYTSFFFLSLVHLAQIAVPLYTLGGLTSTVCGLVDLGFLRFEV